MSLSSVDKSFHAPESHLMSLWIPRGPNTVERRCSLYCATISHITSCPWLPPSIFSSLFVPSALNRGVPCESLANSPVHTAEERGDCKRLTLPLVIGQGSPWEEPQDSSLICYTHTSSRPPERRHSTNSKHHLTSLSPLFILLIHSYKPHVQPHIHKGIYAHIAPCSVTWRGVIPHLGLLMFWAIVSLLLTPFTLGPKITLFTSC